MIRICSTLAQNGYEVELVGRKKRNSFPIAEQQPYQQKRIPCYFEKGKMFYLEYNLRLFIYLLFQSFDAVCAIDLDTLLPAFTISRLKRKTCIYDAHEYFTETPEVVRRPIIQKVWEAIARFIIPKLQHCYTVSPGLAGIFEQRYGTPFAVIRNVPTLTAIGKTDDNPALTTRNPELATRFTILYQGALNEGRGLEQMISAMPALPFAELWIAGEGDLSTELRNIVYAQNIDNQIKFLGFVQPDQLKKITQKANIGINFLEKKGLSYYYSLANKVFDFVHAQVPCITMNFPEYKRLNEEYQVFLLIDDLEQNSIVQAIKRLYEEKELYKLLQDNCAKARQEWNWEKEKLVLIEFYQNCLDGD